MAVHLCLGFALAQDQVLHIKGKQKAPSLFYQK